FGDVERRLVEQVERSVAREATRLTEEAAVEFNAAIRTTREEAARRLSGELDRAIEAFTRQAERVLGERLAEVGQSGGGEIERRLQNGISGRATPTERERRLQNVISGLEQRQDEFVMQLERRMAEVEGTLRQRMEGLAQMSARRQD